MALALALALAASAHAQTPAAVTSRTPATPALSYSNVLPDSIISATLPLEFRLAAPLASAQGQLTLLVNGNDIGSFLQTSDALHYVLEPAQFALPAGELVIELVFEPTGGGEPITLLLATVMLRGNGDEATGQVDPGIPPDGTALAGQDGSAGQPEGGQVGSEPTPPGFKPKAELQAGLVSSRRTLNGTTTDIVTRELGLQLGLRYESDDDGRRLALGSNFVGNSVQNKAVRFGTAGSAAQKIDLNDYLLEFQTASARLSLGAASMAGNPLLGQSFDNRGISSTYRWNSGFDVAMTSQSASALIGGNPLFGFTDVQRRVSAVTVGWEAMPDQPGALRIETTSLTGSVGRGLNQPLVPAGFNAPQPIAPPVGSGASPSPEHSRGLGLRVQWAPVNSIYKVDAAYAKSTSYQTDPITGLPTTTGRNAYFVDGTARVFDDAADAGQRARRLVLRVRHEFADTDYRSVAGGMMGDIRRTLLGAEGLFGPVQAQYNHSFGHNNVSRIVGLPVLQTVTDTLSLALPLSRLMSDPQAPAGQEPQDASNPISNSTALALAPPGPSGSWWPTLQLGWQHNRQKPVDLPASVLPALVPAVATTNATMNAQWSRNQWTWSGGITYGMRDNQQAGSENEDQRAHGVQAQVQWQVSPDFSTTMGLRRSRATATDTGVAQIQNGLDLGLAWQHDTGWIISAQYGSNGDRDSIATQENRGRNWQLQAGKTWKLPLGLGQPVPVQLSLRLQQQLDRNSLSFGGFSANSEQRSRTVGILLSATL